MGERFRQSADSYMKPLQNSIFNGCCFVGECRSFLKTQKLIERENFPLLAVFCGVVDGRSFARQRARSFCVPPRRRPFTAGGGKPSVQWEESLLAGFAAKSPLPAGFLIGMPQILENLGAPVSFAI